MSNDNKSGDKEAGAAAAGKAPDSDKLNALLAKWDDDGSQKGSDKSEPLDPKIAREIGELRYEMDMPKVVKLVKGEMKVSDDFVEKYVNGAASRDSNLIELWDNRKSDSAAFEKAMKGLNEQLARELGLDAKKGEDKDDKGLAAAARMARDSKPAGNTLDDVNFGELSDTDFALKKQEVFRLAKAGKLTA